MKAERFQLALHGGDGRLEGGVLAGDEAFCLHGNVRLVLLVGVRNNSPKVGAHDTASMRSRAIFAKTASCGGTLI